MKKLLLFVIVVYALLSIDHPIIKEPRDKIFNTVMSNLSDSSKVNTEVKATRALKAIKESMSFTDEQLKHLEANFQSVREMYRWEAKYCKTPALNEYFFGDDLRQVCDLLAKTH
ncbi:hypothetical protein V1358_10760 [Pseudoalteromonas sp. YIC-656]|uniref:hypothetical protein n=1 Tax=Pseudoalteromonas pernae TaxID=3118054 RepID=UPI0032422666